MKIPRDCSGPELGRALRKFGYAIDRQTGSHMIMTSTHCGEHHVTVPNLRPIKVGTLQSMLKAVAVHHKISIEQLLRELEL